MRGRSLGRGRIRKLKKRDGTFVYVGDWTDSLGTRRRQELASDARTAQQVFADLIHKRDLELAGLGTQAGQDRSIAELTSAYLDDLEARSSVHHVQNVRRILAGFRGALRAQRVRDVQVDEVLRYRRARQAGGAANQTINKEVGCLRAMFSWAVRCRLIALDPLAALQPLPSSKAHQRYRRRALTEDEVQRFLAAAEHDDVVEAERAAAVRTIEGRTKGAPYVARDRTPRVPQYPLWRSFLETGARWGELTTCAWGDIDFKRGTLVLRAENTKSRKERRIPLRADLVGVLSDLRQHQVGVLGRLPRASERVFLTPRGCPWARASCNAKRLFDRLLEAAGISRTDGLGQKIDIHALRHTFASRLARAHVGLSQAQHLLGHSDPKLTAAIYTHLEADDLRGAVEALPSLGGGCSPGIPGSNLAMAEVPVRRVARKSLSDMERAKGLEPSTSTLGS